MSWLELWIFQVVNTLGWTCSLLYLCIIIVVPTFRCQPKGLIDCLEITIRLTLTVAICNGPQYQLLLQGTWIIYQTSISLFIFVKTEPRELGEDEHTFYLQARHLQDCSVKQCKTYFFRIAELSLLSDFIPFRLFRKHFHPTGSVAQWHCWRRTTTKQKKLKQ